MKTKKAVVAVLAFILCMSLCVVAFAAPSPVGGAVSAKDANGNPVTVEVSAVANEAQLKSEIDTAKAPGTVAWLQDVTVPGYTGGAITLTLAVDGVKAGDTVTVIHYVNGAWEYVKPDSVSDGQVVVTLSSLSPVGVVVKSASAGSGSDSTSPKTGDMDWMMILAVVAIAAAGTALLTCKGLKKAEK